MKLFSLLFLFLLAFFQSFGQVNHTRTIWAFGKNALVTFDSLRPVLSSTGYLDAYSGSACHCNKNGVLVLATNGNAVYTKNGELLTTINNPDPKTGTYDQVIITKNTEETKFYVFSIAQGIGIQIIDVDLVEKTAIARPDALSKPNNTSIALTAVKHCFLDAYWLITSDIEGNFITYLVTPVAIGNPVISRVGSNHTSLGDMTSNWAGTQLAVSNYGEDWVELYDFDKSCGSVSLNRRLNKIDADDDRPHGLCFAPDDKSLYVAWSYQQSRIAQYDLAKPGTIYNVYSSAENINDVEMALDGKLYVNVHYNGIPSIRMHVLANPNSIAGGGTRVKEDAILLTTGTNGAFEFPNFIQNHTGGNCDGQTAIWTALGQEYYICDLDNETTKLDAGKGFKKYKWTPTGDTTQWIIVEDLGEYIVIVDAFNGCQGMGSTIVKRRCDMSYHIPNAFTPNADNLNDAFRVVGKHIDEAILSIYNRWGELIYLGETWDGANAIAGVYFYTVTIKGYQQKIAVNELESGTVHLVR